jgi:hypothetical protein
MTQPVTSPYVDIPKVRYNAPAPPSARRAMLLGIINRMKAGGNGGNANVQPQHELDQVFNEAYNHIIAITGALQPKRRGSETEYEGLPLYLGMSVLHEPRSTRLAVRIKGQPIKTWRLPFNAPRNATHQARASRVTANVRPATPRARASRRRPVPTPRSRKGVPRRSALF